MSKIKDENYYQISGWMINQLNLKGNTLNVYAIIYGFTQDGQSVFTGSRQYLCDFTGATKPTIDKALDELVNKGFITRIVEVLNGVTFNKYKANLDILNFTSSKETLPPSKENLLGGSKKTLPNNIYIDNKEYNKEIYTSILDYLNEKIGTKYRVSSRDTQSHINARLKDGFVLDDFIRVIDNKVAQWKDDKVMCQYLRPSTLFGTKFESYLNEKPVVKKSEKYTKEQIGTFFTDLDSVVI